MRWDKSDHARAFTMLDQVDLPVRTYVKELLDEYHGEHRPQRYYDILLGYWLQWLAHATIVALDLPREADEENRQNISLTCFRTEGEFSERVSNDERFHALLRTLLENSENRPVDFDHPTIVFKYVSPSAGGMVRRLVKRCLAKVGADDAILVCLPYAKCSKLDWITFVFQARKVMRWDDLDGPIPSFAVNIDSDWRLAKYRSTYVDPGSLLSAIKRLVPLLIPVAYLEAFGELRRTVMRSRIGKPQGFYSANALYGHLPFKLLAAEHQQTALILSHQHGGSFGMDLRHAPEEYERSVSDFFYTWGWGGRGRGTRDLSPPSFKKIKRSGRWKLMLCLADFPKTNYRIQFFPAGDGANKTIEDTLNFARGLSVNEGEAILVRPHSSDYGRGWIDQLRRLLPTAQLDDFGKRAIERFAASQIVFHNYISTGWLESIWLDVPTLALYDPQAYAFRNDALHHVTLLERFGLLHQSGVSAAQFYTSIREDIDGWWNQSDFRRARADFSDQYIRVRADWKMEWTREFAWLLKNREAIHLSNASGLGQLQAAENNEKLVRR